MFFDNHYNPVFVQPHMNHLMGKNSFELGHRESVENQYPVLKGYGFPILYAEIPMRDR
jgi:hypothetical protein